MSLHVRPNDFVPCGRKSDATIDEKHELRVSDLGAMIPAARDAQVLLVPYHHEFRIGDRWRQWRRGGVVDKNHLR